MLVEQQLRVSDDCNFIWGHVRDYHVDTGVVK